jgi:hypothetical protein
MKNGLQQILGKRIAAVVVAASTRAPKEQVFLVFHDGTRFEFYGESFTCCAGVDEAKDIERYVESGQGKITKVYVDSRPALRAGPALEPTSPGRANALRLAIEAIARARRP